MDQRFGVYLNIEELKVVRINSPYWMPSGEECVLLTPDVNTTLLRIRDLVKEKKLVDEPDSIVWGVISQAEEGF